MTAGLVRLDDRLPIIDAERADEQIRAGIVGELGDLVDPVELVEPRELRAVLGVADQLYALGQAFILPRRRNIAPQRPSAIESPTKAI